MGIKVDEVKALLDAKGVALSGGAISLHDQDQIPLKNLGSGSSRLLVAGLQRAVGRSSIFIVDEVEFGLEPYRIVRLLDSLGAKRNDQSQQVFLTTHSPIVLRELAAVQLFAVRSHTQTISHENPARKITQNWMTTLGGDESAQKTLRACAEAFLAPSVIVCEGKTEIGLIRGIDLHRQDAALPSMLAHGCHWADGGGSSMIERAHIFARMGYRTALLMDSDVTYGTDVYAALQTAGVSVFRWLDGYSTEAALFASIPGSHIPALLGIACDWRTADSVDSKIRNVSGNQYSLQSCCSSFTEVMRPILGKCAGDGKWFKDIEPAERALREVVSPVWTQANSLLTGPIDQLWQWISPVPNPPRNSG